MVGSDDCPVDQDNKRYLVPQLPPFGTHIVPPLTRLSLLCYGLRPGCGLDNGEGGKMGELGAHHESGETRALARFRSRGVVLWLVCAASDTKAQASPIVVRTQPATSPG